METISKNFLKLGTWYSYYSYDEDKIYIVPMINENDKDYQKIRASMNNLYLGKYIRMTHYMAFLGTCHQYNRSHTIIAQYRKFKNEH